MIFYSSITGNILLLAESSGIFNSAATFGFFRSHFKTISKQQTNEEFLDRFITKIGAYVMFCYLNSWKLISDKNTHQQNKEYRNN